jgi:hypothetical protein
LVQQSQDPAANKRADGRRGDDEPALVVLEERTVAGAASPKHGIGENIADGLEDRVQQWMGANRHAGKSTGPGGKRTDQDFLVASGLIQLPLGPVRKPPGNRSTGRKVIVGNGT